MLLKLDATHKLNNIGLPLFIQVCIDGNGGSEIISLFICKSESGEVVGAMLDAFQDLNPVWTKTKIILEIKTLLTAMSI